MKHFCISLAALLGIAITAVASPVPSCTSLEGDNINNTTDFGNGCTLGGLTFSNFSYSSAPVGTSVFLSAVGTGVVGNDVDLGFQLTTATPPVDIILFYDVSNEGTGPSIVGVDNQQNGNQTTIQEVVCSVAFSSGICPTTPTNDVLANFTNPPTTSATFAPQSSVYIEKDISLPDGTSFISSFVNSQDLSGVPEPGTFLLLGAGLGGIGLMRKRKSTPQA
jgi:hypothetical protein